MLGMKNHFDISGSIEIREVDIAGVACIITLSGLIQADWVLQTFKTHFEPRQSYRKKGVLQVV